jgi:hypothetical protein
MRRLRRPIRLSSAFATFAPWLPTVVPWDLNALTAPSRRNALRSPGCVSRSWRPDPDALTGPLVKEFQETVIEAIQAESPETARRIIARLKERRALRSSADLPTLAGGADDGALA